MKTPRISEAELDEVEAAVIRERELNDALRYLDRAISRFATQEWPSRWSSAHCAPPRRSLQFPGLAPVMRLYAAAFRGERAVGELRP